MGQINAAQTVWFEQPQRVAVREIALPDPAPGDVRVATRLSAISTGTELLLYRGEFPAEMPIDATIDALQGGFRYPVQYGYAAVGTICAVGDQIDPSQIGRLMFAFQPHASHFNAPFDQLLPVPDGVSAESAAFLPNMETAVSLLMDAAPVIGERAVVFGQGVVGLLTTLLLAQLPLESIIAVDPAPLRRTWAQRLGAHTVLDPTAPQFEAQLRDLTDGGADLAFELSGNPAALDAAISAVGYGGRVIIGSWYGDKSATLHLGGAFHRNHIRLISSQVSTLAPRWRGRWTKARRLALAWRCCRDHDPARLVTHRIALADAPRAYELLDRHSAETVQLLLTYTNPYPHTA